jgi:hypothetical protein
MYIHFVEWHEIDRRCRRGMSRFWMSSRNILRINALKCLKIRVQEIKFTGFPQGEFRGRLLEMFKAINVTGKMAVVGKHSYTVHEKEQKLIEEIEE